MCRKDPLRDLVSNSISNLPPIDHTDDRGDRSTPTLLAPNSDNHLWGPKSSTLPGSSGSNPSQCVITFIRASDVAVDLDRIPVGFYVETHAEGTHQRTRNKPVTVHDRHVEWNDEIFLPSEPSSSIHLRVCASYELSPMLGNGETLGTFVLDISKLFENGETVNSVELSPPEGGTVSRCSLLCVTAELRKCTPDMLANVLNQQCHISNSEVTSSLAQITDEGHEYHLRYQKYKKPDDLNHSISCFERALQACPPTDQHRAAALFNLATVQFNSYQDGVSPPDFDIPITLYRDALELRPLGHPDRPATLSHLARAIVFRFRELGDDAYAEEARNLVSEVQSVCSVDSYEYQLADEILRDCTFDGTTTGSSIIVSPSTARLEGNDRRALDHCAQDPAILIALAFTSMERFEQYKRMDDINESITLMEKAVELTEENDLEWPMRTISLAIILGKRFSRFQTMEDLDRSISVLDNVAQRVPNDHPDRPVGLIELGLFCSKRFRRLGQVADKDRSLIVMEEALKLVTMDHPNRSTLLIQSGDVLLWHYKHFDDPAHLDRSISLMEGCVQGTMDDLTSEQSTDPFIGSSIREEMLDIFFDGQFMEYKRVKLLAEAYGFRFHCSGDRVDLDKSVAMKEEALELNQGTWEPRFRGLFELGGSLLLRHCHFGDMTDLHTSTSLLEEAAQLVPHDHPERSKILAPLGACLLLRSDRQIVDVDRSISMQEEALRYISDDDPNKRVFLSSIALSYLGRSDLLHGHADLDKSTSMLEEVLRLTPAHDPHRDRYLAPIAAMGASRLLERNLMANLDEPIAMVERAAESVSDGDPNGVPITMILLSMMSFRALQSPGDGNIMDLDKWISIGEKAVSCLPARSHALPSMLSCLGNLFLLRFILKGRKVADIDKANSLVEKALNLTPDHRRTPLLLMATGVSYLGRFALLGSIPALRSAISFFSSATRSQSSSQPLLQIKAFVFWHQCAVFLRKTSPSEAIEEQFEAFKCAIGLFPRLAWLGLPFKARYTELREAADITQSAVSFVVSLGRPTTAVEWLEQGRCVVWAQLLELHTPLDQLRHTHPDLADRFERLSGALQRSSATDNISLQCFSEQGQEESLERQARRHRELVAEWEDLLELIQTIPGFEGCFSPKTFSQLQVSARLGPVIILNFMAECGYALILLDELDEPLYVTLPDINKQEAERLRTSFRELLLTDGRVISREDPHRAARVVGQNGCGFGYILSELWTKVVKPVLHTLGFFDPGEPTRVFWCPAGPFSFLPIHAAGNYDAPGIGNKASDFVISSYIPTLSVLLPSPEHATVLDNVRLLAVPQPLSDGQSRLHGTQVEIEGIRETVGRHSSSHVQLHESGGDVEGVLSAMEQSDWVHFACHGVQDAGSPTDSGLCLADGRRLRLSDIIRLSRPRSGLAFLSACQTATGAVEFSDEAVHLSAGMLFAGYSSVIGTMWSIGDNVAPQVAKDVYEQLFQDGRTPDSREAARALHYAVERLRQRGAPFIAWVPFIHMGV